MDVQNTIDLTEGLEAGIRSLGVTLSAAQYEKLLTYLTLLSKWSKFYNLTAVRDPAQRVTHHLLDSLAAVTAFAGAKMFSTSSPVGDYREWYWQSGPLKRSRKCGYL